PIATAADQDDGVLLEVVALAGDVRGDLDATREADTGDLAERRVRLLRGGGVDTRADPAPLGRALQCRRLALLGLGLTALADQLPDGGHREPLEAPRARPSTRGGASGRPSNLGGRRSQGQPPGRDIR